MTVGPTLHFQSVYIIMRRLIIKSATNTSDLLQTSIPTKGTRSWGWFNRAVARQKAVEEQKDKTFQLPLGRLSLMNDKGERETRMRTYFDVNIDDKPAGRIVFELAVSNIYLVSLSSLVGSELMKVIEFQSTE